MAVETTADDLFRKIGALTVENEVLHRENQMLRARLEELEVAASADPQEETQDGDAA